MDARYRFETQSELTSHTGTLDVLVIGAGAAGICMGIKLKQTGLRFCIAEKADEVGGTWRENRYPGCVCDTQSHHYSFSFARNPDWSHRYAGQLEILDYLKQTAKDFGLIPHIHFGDGVKTARFDEENALWNVTTLEGKRFVARFLISAAGQLSHPATPSMSGLESFKEEKFHTAQAQPLTRRSSR